MHSQTPTYENQSVNHPPSSGQVRFKSCPLVLQLLQDCHSLRRAPRELWLVFIIKFFESIAYYSFLRILALMLSDVFGYDDKTAGFLYGAYGSFMNLYVVFAGFLRDRHGITKVIKLGVFLTLFARITLLFLVYHSAMKNILMVVLLVLLPIGKSLMLLVLLSSVKCYTDIENCAFAIGIFNAINKGGLLVSGIMVDIIRIFMKGDNERATYVATLLAGTICSVIILPISILLRDIDVSSNSNSYSVEIVEPKRQVVDSSNSSNDDPTQSKSSNVESPYQPLTSLKFWRFILLSVILTNTKMVTRNMDLTMPAYMIRTFGNDVPFGLIMSVYPATVMILMPIITARTSHVRASLMILFGSIITSLGFIFIALWPDHFWAVVMFVLVISAGECMWDPRLQEFSFSQSEKGNEGLYTAIIYAPSFFARLPIGLLTGYLLGSHCPSYGDCDGRSLWFALFYVSTISPVFLVLLWPILFERVNHEQRNSHVGVGCDGEQQPELLQPFLPTSTDGVIA